MPIFYEGGNRVIKMNPSVSAKVQKLMTENGYPVPILETPSEKLSRYWDIFTKAVRHVEDGTPQHFPNPTRKIGLRYFDGETRHGVGVLPWRTVQFGNPDRVGAGWYAITPIGRIDGENTNMAVAHGPYNYRHAKSLVRQWLHNFYGPEGKNAQADFWLGEAEEDDIEVLKMDETALGVPGPHAQIQEIAIDRRDGRTLWEDRYPKGTK